MTRKWMTSSRSIRLPGLGGWLALAKGCLVLIVAVSSAVAAVAAEIRPAADAPQPLPPEESLKRFRLPPGFGIELVASEPLLADPTDMAFDAAGRLFVCELYGYNLEGHYDVLELNKTGQLDRQVRRIPANPEALARAERESHGTVKRLEDTNGDARMDRMQVWADDLPPCYGVVAARDGVVVLCAPHIVYLGDPDGDGRPEVRETLFAGFGVGEMWTRISNPQWGVDNWIYAACGDGSAGTIRGPHLREPVVLGNTGFRFKPDGTAFEPVSGGTSGFGLALTDWDDRFLVSNQQHALHVAPLPHRYLARNPYFAPPPTVNNICGYGHPARVFPIAPPDPWRVERSQQAEWVKFYGSAETSLGLVTAACAPFIYRADQFPPEYRGAHFSCECAYNLVHLCRLEPDGTRFRAVRALEDAEFLTSSETWFRPVNLADGPDGALYIVDMYREIIEDYSAIPRYLQQQYGLIKGWDRGRIWRVYYGGQARQTAGAGRGRLETGDPMSLARELSSSNAWRRLTAQRLIVERRDVSVLPALERLAREGVSGLARLHALYALEGLGRLDPGPVVAALGDPAAGVRRHALALAEPWLDREPSVLDRVLALVDDPDAAVRLQLAFTLGETRDPRRLATLAGLAGRFGADEWMRAAIASSVPEHAEPLVRELVQTGGLREANRPVARALVGVIGARRQGAEIGRVLQTAAACTGTAAEAFQVECLTALLEGLARGQAPELPGPTGRDALRTLLVGPSPGVRRLALQLSGVLGLTGSGELRAVFEGAAAQAVDTGRPWPERQAALEVLASAPWEVLATAATNLLAAHQPLDVQLAAVKALAASDHAGVGELLLAGWGQYSPKTQAAVWDALFQRQDRIRALLAALERKAMPQPAFDALRRHQLLTNPDEDIRRRAEPILARAGSRGDRQAVLDRFQPALDLPRDAERGRTLFATHCASCHQVEGVGVATGPELIAATKGRADATILLDILEPSDQITVGYRTYTVVMRNGEVLSGILAAETATSVTLPDADGIPQTVLRQDIASIGSADLSLMPANFDELLAPQDVADLLGYLRHVAGAGPGPVLTLFDEDGAWVAQLNEGDGTAALEVGDAASGTRSLRITPPQRYAGRIPGWEYRIVERPQAPGEYRYLRFAWKSPAATGLMLELASRGEWPPAEEPARRYYCGENSTGWQARRVAVGVPADWTFVEVDLWQDCGEFTLTGLAPTAMGGPGWFDDLRLLREPGRVP